MRRKTSRKGTSRPLAKIRAIPRGRMGESMKAYAFLEQNKSGFIEKEAPICGARSAIVRPLFVSPCTSDVHNVELGNLAANRILGHEAVAEVVEVGSMVRDFKPGDMVIVPAVTPDWGALGSQRGFHQHDHGMLAGYQLASKIDGVFAELCRVPFADENLGRLPGSIDPAQAVMLSDMVTTGFYGAELADICFGDTVCVLGIGPVGQMAILGAKLRGAGRILAVGTRPVCVEAAKFYGATDIISYKDGSVSKQVMELTKKQGADRCIIAGGDDESLKEAVSLICPGGAVANVGYLTTSGDIPFPNGRWGFGMGNKTIKGGLCPGGRYRMEQLANLMKYGRIDVSPMITHIFNGFENIGDAFRLMEQKPPELIKVVVRL